MSTSSDIIIISYLEYIISKIKKKEISENEKNKIYQILFDGMTDCCMRYEDRDMLECFSIGWLVKETGKTNE